MYITLHISNCIINNLETLHNSWCFLILLHVLLSMSYGDLSSEWVIFSNVIRSTTMLTFDLLR